MCFILGSVMASLFPLGGSMPRRNGETSVSPITVAEGRK